MRRSVGARAAFFWTAAVLACLAAVGCGASGSKPHGKVLMNGEPYKADPAEVLRIAFIGEGDSGNQVSSVAQVSPDGAFTVPGPTNAGIPAGKYKITVQTAPGGAGTAGPGAAVGDKFRGKYADPAKTPLTVEITSSTPEIVIDVGKGTATTGG